MTAKVNLLTAAPDVMKVWTGASLAIAACLEPSLIELVKIRASQINGCANCINMHTTEARRQGETEQRIYLLSAWREAPCYTERERAALGWTEALARLSEGHENSKANRIETMKGPAESGQICSVGRRKIAKKIAKNKRCYANTLRPCSRMLLKVMKGG